MDPRQCFFAEYDRKDAILYSLSIGFSTGDWSYVHENDQNFRVAPAFALALMFRAISDENNLKPSIPSFPPPMLQRMGLIPKSSLLDPTHSLHDYPALHTFQSIAWNQSLPVPDMYQAEKVYLIPRFLEIHPKPIGVFVSTETNLYHGPISKQSSLLCTMVSTTLLLGLDASSVRAYGLNSIEPKEEKRDEAAIVLEVEETIGQNAALLYRIASGDSNRIHVDASPFGKPILHGLCTLGIVSRVLLQNHEGMQLRQIEGRFVKPIFVGDTIRIRVWVVAGVAPGQLLFQVSDASTGDIKVSRGRAMLQGDCRPRL